MRKSWSSCSDREQHENKWMIQTWIIFFRSDIIRSSHKTLSNLFTIWKSQQRLQPSSRCCIFSVTHVSACMSMKSVGSKQVGFLASPFLNKFLDTSKCTPRRVGQIKFQIVHSTWGFCSWHWGHTSNFLTVIEQDCGPEAVTLEFLKSLWLEGE